MGALVPIFVFCQALGAVIGTIAAVWGELAYLRAMRDKSLDRAEKAHLEAIGRGLRFGMTLLLLSSFGLVVAAFVLQTAPQPAFTPGYWSLVAVALLITLVSWGLSRRRITFALGSAIVFTGWWFLAALALGKMPLASFGAAVALFVVMTGAFYGLLRYLRFLVAPRAL